MEGQTNCALCEYKSRNIVSLKQHMESKHNVFNMTIVQVLTQQVERVDKLESEIEVKEQLIKQAEVDLDVAKKALQKERESLEEKEKAFDELIKTQKKKAGEESNLVEELKFTKALLTKAHQDLETQTIRLNAQLEKEASAVSKQTVFQPNEVSTQTVYQMNEVSTQRVSEVIEVSNVKQEESEANNEEKKISYPANISIKPKDAGEEKSAGFTMIIIIR